MEKKTLKQNYSLHSAFWFDWLLPDGGLYWEDEWLKYELRQLKNRELLLVDNWDAYTIDKEIWYYVNNIDASTAVLHCERENTEYWVNLVFYKINA